MPRAAAMPTRRPVKLPGPVVTAIRSISENVKFAASITRFRSGIRASACPRVIGRLSPATMPPYSVSSTAAEQAASAVSMASTRIRQDLVAERLAQSPRLHWADFGHVGNEMTQQILDA